jgi:PAS domain S-box-containing protein
MQLGFNTYAILPSFALLVAVVLVNRAWRYRSESIGKTFLVLMVGLAWWSFCVIMEYITLGLSGKIFWVEVSYLSVVSIPVGWLIFCLKYTDRSQWIVRRHMLALIVVPMITIIVVCTNGLHHLMWRQFWLDTSVYPPVDANTHGWWFWVHATYSYLLLCWGTFVLAVQFRKSSGVHRRQTSVLLVAAFLPWCGNILYLAGIGPFYLIDPTPLAFAVTGVAFFWGITKLHLLDILPVAHDTVLKSMADGEIVVNNKRSVVDLNPAAERITGLRKAEAIGKDYRTILPGLTGSVEIGPDTREARATLVIKQGETQRYYEVSITGIVTRERLQGHLLLLRDDTERTLAEVSLREAHNELERARDLLEARVEQRTVEVNSQKKLVEGILGALPTAVLLVDRDTRVIHANMSFLHDHIGSDGEKQIVTLSQIVANDTLSRSVQASIATSSAAHGVEFRERLNGHDSILSADILPMPGERTLIVLNDMTLERERQERLYLSDRLASVGEMAAGVAHELNNPLTSIVGIASLLAEEPFPAEAREDMDAICSEAQRAAAIVKGLLSFARKHNVEKRRVALDDIIDDVVRFRAHSLKSRNITVIHNRIDGVPEVMVDYFQMQQVFMNVVVNAEQAMADAHGKGSLLIKVEQSAETIRVSFSDDGPGIRNENLKRIFDPFFTTKEVGKGTGLGLSICYGIITEHGGGIYAESEYGKGATFIVELPISGKEEMTAVLGEEKA